MLTLKFIFQSLDYWLSGNVGRSKQKLLEKEAEMETVRGIPILEIVEHEKKKKKSNFLRDKLSLNKQTLRFKP